MSVKASNGYPFTTRKQIIDRIASEPGFVVECVRLIDGKWMASHRARSAAVLAKIAAGNVSAEDLAEAVALVTPYARTISRILRERQISEGHSELMGVAAVFGVVRPSSAYAIPTATPAETEAARPPAVDAAAATEAPAAQRPRRGRPLGSKNKKPRSDSKRQPTKRHRRS